MKKYFLALLLMSLSCHHALAASKERPKDKAKVPMLMDTLEDFGLLFNILVMHDLAEKFKLIYPLE